MITIQLPISSPCGRWGPSGSDEVVAVRCFKPGGTPVCAPFVVTFSQSSAKKLAPPLAYGYVHFEPGAGGIVTSFNSAGATNTLLRAGTGLRLASFPQIGQLQNTVLVTPVQAGPSFCNLSTLWGTAPPNVTIRDVTCYNAAGAHASRQAMITYTSKV